jgi:hypothetical protein
MTGTQLAIDEESHWNPIKKGWRLIGSDIIKCPATGEHVDKPSCQSSNMGEGCMHLKDGECKYRGEDLR